jgi:hypothetical protein
MKQFLQRAVHLVGLVVVAFVAITLLEGPEAAVALEGTCCSQGHECEEGEGCCPHENLNLNICETGKPDYCVGVTECPPAGG